MKPSRRFDRDPSFRRLAVIMGLAFVVAITLVVAAYQMGRRDSESAARPGAFDGANVPTER
jgi:hypothetical protein